MFQINDNLVIINHNIYIKKYLLYGEFWILKSHFKFRKSVAREFVVWKLNGFTDWGRESHGLSGTPSKSEDFKHTQDSSRPYSIYCFFLQKYVLWDVFAQPHLRTFLKHTKWMHWLTTVHLKKERVCPKGALTKTMASLLGESQSRLIPPKPTPSFTEHFKRLINLLFIIHSISGTKIP